MSNPRKDVIASRFTSNPANFDRLCEPMAPIRNPATPPGGGLPAGGRSPVLGGRDRTARTPHVVDDQDPAADDLLVFGELDELGPGEELGFLAAGLEGENDGRRQDM